MLQLKYQLATTNLFYCRKALVPCPDSTPTGCNSLGAQCCGVCLWYCLGESLEFPSTSGGSTAFGRVDQHSELKNDLTLDISRDFFFGPISVILGRTTTGPNIRFFRSKGQGDMVTHVLRPSTACWLMSLALMRPCMQQRMVGMVGNAQCC